MSKRGSNSELGTRNDALTARPQLHFNNEQIGRHEQEQTRTDTKRRTSISVKEETTYDTR